MSYSISYEEIFLIYMKNKTWSNSFKLSASCYICSLPKKKTESTVEGLILNT